MKKHNLKYSSFEYMFHLVQIPQLLIDLYKKCTGGIHDITTRGHWGVGPHAQPFGQSFVSFQAG
jgi:hypothetical protein